MPRPPPTGENGKTVHADSLGACLAGTRSNARPAATSAAPAAKPTSATVAAVRAEPSGPASQRRSASQWAASLSTAAVNPAAAPVAIATLPGPISAQARVRRALGPATLRCTVSAGSTGAGNTTMPGRLLSTSASQVAQSPFMLDGHSSWAQTRKRSRASTSRLASRSDWPSVAASKHAARSKANALGLTRRSPIATGVRIPLTGTPACSGDVPPNRSCRAACSSFANRGRQAALAPVRPLRPRLRLEATRRSPLGCASSWSDVLVGSENRRSPLPSRRPPRRPSTARAGLALQPGRGSPRASCRARPLSVSPTARETSRHRRARRGRPLRTPRAFFYRRGLAPSCVR
jgi:hypothetical protein